MINNIPNNLSHHANILPKELHEQLAEQLEKTIDTITSNKVKESINSSLNQIEQDNAINPEDKLEKKLDTLQFLYTKLDTPAFFKACPQREVILKTIKEKLIELTTFTVQNKNKENTTKLSYFEMQYDKYDFHNDISNLIDNHQQYDKTLKKMFDINFTMNNPLHAQTPLRLCKTHMKNMPTTELLYSHAYEDFSSKIQNNANKLLPTSNDLIGDAKLTGKNHKRFVNTRGELTTPAKNAINNPDTFKAIIQDIKDNPKNYLQEDESDNNTKMLNPLAKYVLRHHIATLYGNNAASFDTLKSNIIDILKKTITDIPKTKDAAISSIDTDNAFILALKTDKSQEDIYSLTLQDVINNLETDAYEPNSDNETDNNKIMNNLKKLNALYLTTGGWLSQNDQIVLYKYLTGKEYDYSHYDYASKNHCDPSKNLNIGVAKANGDCYITSALMVAASLKDKSLKASNT